MNFEQLPFFDMKPIGPSEKKMNVVRGSEFITIRQSRVGITNQLYYRLGKPEYLEVVLDSSKKVLGIKKTDVTNVNRREVCFRKTASTEIKQSGNIVDAISEIVNIDLKTYNYRAIPSINYDDYIIFDLNKLIPVAINRRNS